MTSLRELRRESSSSPSGVPQVVSETCAASPLTVPSYVADLRPSSPSDVAINYPPSSRNSVSPVSVFLGKLFTRSGDRKSVV